VLSTTPRELHRRGEDLSMKAGARSSRLTSLACCVSRARFSANARAAQRRILMMSRLRPVTPPTQGAYSSSKHALEGLSNALAWSCIRLGSMLC